MATVFDEYATEHKRSVARDFVDKRLNAKDIHIENVACLRWEVVVALSGSQLSREV
jgi:hypothetical protein